MGVIDPSRVKVYDFKRPDKFSSEQIRTLQFMHETFARLSTTGLSASTRCIAQVRLAAVDQCTYEEFVHSIPVPSPLAIFGMEPLKGQAVLEIDPAASFAIVDRLLGGAGRGPAPSRDLTDIECGLLESVIVRFFACLREAWTQVIDFKPSLAQIETNPQFAQIVPPSEMVVLVSLAIGLGEAEGMMNLCFPFITIEPIIDKLSAKYWYSAARRGPDARTARAILGHLSGLGIDAEICREGDTLSLRDIGRLRKGSLVRLPGFGEGRAILRMGGEDLLLLGARGGSAARPASYAVLGSLRREQLEELEGDEGEGGAQRTAAAIKGALSDFGAGLDSKLSGMGRALEELLRAQARMADQLAFGQAEEGQGGELPIRERARPFDFVHRVDQGLFLGFIQSEHPQTIALVLSYLEPQAAAQALAGLPPELQAEVLRRVATLGPVMPEILREVERVLEKKLSFVASEEIALAGGVDGAIDILNIASRGVERGVIESLERSDPELAEELKKRMFVFEDVILLGRETFAKVAARADRELLSRALKAVPDAIRDFVWGCLPDPERRDCVARYEALGRLRLHEVEEAQQSVIALIREMEESGEIVIERPGEAMV
jgi:flagellar motor switch protein FliM